MCSNIWTSTSHYPMLCLKIAGWVANSVDPDETPHSAASHLGLNCLLRPVCLNTYGKYGNVLFFPNSSKSLDTPHSTLVLLKLLTQLHWVDHSTTTLWTGLFPISECPVSIYYYCLTEIPVCNSKGVDPDQMPQSAASDLGLHCLPDTLLGVSQLK